MSVNSKKWFSDVTLVGVCYIRVKQHSYLWRWCLAWNLNICPAMLILQKNGPMAFGWAAFGFGSFDFIICHQRICNMNSLNLATPDALEPIRTSVKHTMFTSEATCVFLQSSVFSSDSKILIFWTIELLWKLKSIFKSCSLYRFQ